jgi:hypothetical protein
MRIAHEQSTPWQAPPPVRGGVIVFKTLLQGAEGSPDNFGLMLADTDVTFKSPRHRHNFDQIRFGLDAPTNIGPRRNIEPGDVCYFPEGTWYGPQNQEEAGARSLSMVIQFGGPSGNGYLSLAQVRAGLDTLSAHGRFEGGVFRRETPGPDGRKNQDSYEAIWEHVNGRAIGYSEERYLEPVHMRAQGFAWVDAPGAPGVAVKHLGTFTERGVTASLVRIAPDASYALPALPRQGRLLFVREGSGRLGATDAYQRYTAVHAGADEPLALHAQTATEVLVLALPRF